MAYYILKSYKLRNNPREIFEALSKERNCFFLDSSLHENYSLGRYSFLGIDPFCVLKTIGSNPFSELRRIINKYKFSLPNSPLPFLGGAVGYLSYDLGFFLEKKLQRKLVDDLRIPDCFFAFYNTIIAIDNYKKILYIFAVGFPEKRTHLAKSLCKFNLKKINRLLSSCGAGKNNFRIRPESKPVSFHSNFSHKGYLRAVDKAKKYIKEGDIYQVNLSQRFHAKTDLTGFKIYERLRKISPSSFSAYFDCEDFQILSSSPERFLKLDRDIVITRPMKGTRPRGGNLKEDDFFKKDLLRSPKDKAELVMIVDLERNDLGRICSYNSIKVEELRRLEEYSTVFQTTANIYGHLHKSKDRIDLLRACFPGGSITGCPKIRAMEIIEELEPARRNIYTGSLGYLSFCGDMDFNILIRTILKKNNDLYFGVGGGIVADSTPEEEYNETLIKARAIMEAVSGYSLKRKTSATKIGGFAKNYGEQSSKFRSYRVGALWV